MPRTQPFDEHLDEYEEWFQQHWYVYLSELEAIRHFVPKGKKGIEIGIGTGRFALPLGIKEGVEPSAAMRTFAMQHALTVYNAVAEELPLTDNSCDFALMITTLCFTDNAILWWHRNTYARGRLMQESRSHCRRSMSKIPCRLRQ